MKSKKKFSCLGVIAVLIVSFALLCMGVYLLFNSGGRRDFDAAMVEARAAGMATTPDDLRRFLPDPSENAQPFYAAIIARGAIPQAKADPKTRQIPASEYEVAAKWVETNHRDLDRAERMPHYGLDRPWEKGSGVIFPELSQMKNMTKALSFAAIHYSRNGDVDKAVDCLRKAKAMGKHLGEEPTLIGYLVSVALLAIQDSALVTVAWELRDNPAALQRLKVLSDEPFDPPSLKRGFMGESYYQVQLPEEIARQPEALFGYGNTNDPETLKLKLAVRLPFARYRASAANLRKLTETYRQLTDKPDNKTVEELTKKLDFPPTLSDPLSQTLAQALVPVFSQAGQMQTKMDARQRLGRVAIRLLEVRQKTNGFPSSLKNWGEITTDPFSGKPFIFRATADGFVIGSVGYDRKDDTLAQFNHDPRLVFDGKSLKKY